MLFWLIIGFLIGVFVGYKYPQQVDQVVEKSKQTFADVKSKISKKETPSS
jgi:Na+/H+-dicarboxylate symporter